MADNEVFLAKNFTAIDVLDEDVTMETTIVYHKTHQANIIVLSCIFALALLGNLVVVALLLWRQVGLCRSPKCSASHRTSPEGSPSRNSVGARLTNLQWFILLLSLSDICVAFFTILSQLIWEVTYRFEGNDIACRIVKYLQVVPIYMSTYTMMMLAIDLYISVCHPSATNQRERRRVAILIFIAWSLAIIFGLPQIFIFSLSEVMPGLMQCWGHFQPEWTVQLYVTSFSTAIFLAPLVILIVCYGRICFVIRGHAGNSAISRPQCNTKDQGEISGTVIGMSTLNSCERGNQPRGIMAKKLSAAKSKTLKLSLTVILCHIICWAPYIIVGLWAVYDTTARIMMTSWVVVMRMVNLSSCVNPWIYLVFSALWRTPFTKLDSALSNTDIESNGEKTESMETYPKSETT